MIDKKKYKAYLEKYLQRNSIEINYKKKPPRISCLLPGHVDNDPSAIIYPDSIYCPVCSKKYDIFEVAGLLNNTTNFIEQIKAIEESLNLGSSIDDPVKPSKVKEKFSVSIPLKYEEAVKFYSSPYFIKKGLELNGWGEVIKVWPYRNRDGDIIGVDVRYEKEGKKTIINFWNDRGYISHTKSPPIIYGEFEVFQNPEKLIMINEGCKSAEAARILTEFIPASWSRGAPNAKYVDWSIFKDREGFIFPDDDPPGLQAALDIQKQLPHFKIVQPLEAAKKIKAKGADIVEALQVLDVTALTEYIKTNIYIPKPEPYPDVELNFESQEKSIPEDFEFPFRILGIADDNRAYFIGRHDRLIISSLDGLTQNKLQLLAPMHFWQNEFGYKHKVQWSDAIDCIIEQAGNIDFDTDDIRGRGAWREPDGKICYHDGKKTIGEINEKRLYLRKTKRSIGLHKSAIDPILCTEISKIIKQMSFEKELDAIRCMGWSCISPFAGALPWRPATLLTGESGTGKTTVVDYVVKRISYASIFSGAETTSAGLRQYLNSDSTAIILEEAECDTPKKKQNRDDLFSLMRQSTSDDAPDIVKGSKEGHAVTFKMRNMFMFVATSPEVETVADDNRVFRINMVKPEKNWAEIRTKLKKLITYENCEAIRSLVWQNLQMILNKSSGLTTMLQDITGKDLRTCFAESLLLSAYYQIFQSAKSEKEIGKELQTLFAHDENLQKRNETEELLDRLLDESVFLPDSKTTKTLRCILQSIINNEGSEMSQAESKETVGRYGLNIDLDGNLYIAINHHEIMRIIQKGKGYQRFFWRHPGLIDKNKSMRIAGKTRKCVMLSGIFDDEENIKNEEIPF